MHYTDIDKGVDTIALADPFKRLKALGEYMNEWVDSWPEKPSKSFRRWVYHRYPAIIPGTFAWFRSIATNCFYCNERMVAPKPNNENQTDPKLATIDHWYPKSKGGTEKVVVCCAECNGKKSDTDPVELRKKIFKAVVKGANMWGYDLRKLVRIGEQIEAITNDILYNTGPRVYFIQAIKKRKKGKR